ncbi:MAG: hypothetical protein J5518_02075 [Lachnospiraceae bacterium]|nr:hypothetical protein [Lachnospiraceae bacterium]
MEAQLKQVDELIAKLNTRAAKTKGLPDCGIHVSRSNGCDQYYWVDRVTKKRSYVKKKETDTLRRVAQREYERDLLRKLTRLRENLHLFLSHYDIGGIAQEYAKMAQARKTLINPVVLPGELYAEKWMEAVYEPMPFYENSEFYSDGGIRVRSKSEILIANQLEKYHIPFKYEKPLYLDGLGQIRPDFTCLNVRTGKEFVWEHFGMMDQMGYVNKCIAKIHCYQQNGYIAGENLIMTFESAQEAIHTKEIRILIEKLLL